jgi:dCTP deaminase
VLATTLERIEIGRGLSGHVSGKSSIGRVFVVVHATAGFLDPGFQGQITLEIKNLGPEMVTLLDKTPICQVVMSMLAEPAEKAYGDPSLGSRYFGQMGATEPRK